MDYEIYREGESFGEQIVPKRPYVKPEIIKEETMNFPLEILATASGFVCKQCSSCHGCR